MLIRMDAVVITGWGGLWGGIPGCGGPVGGYDPPRSMILFFPRETDPAEPRVALTPESAAKLVKLGAKVQVEAGLGSPLGWDDAHYAAAGATVVAERAHGLAAADAVLRVRKPPESEWALMRRGVLHVSYLDPFRETELVTGLAAAGVDAVSMEMMPRTTIAQKMDALSSQASLAGYVAVILAAERLHKIFPMMMTPAGTIPPAQVFIIGVGVAGLQAIATARRLGARVTAFDTRPVVEEQVQSLGAKFLKVDLGETGQTQQGYARELTSEQLDKQRAAMAKVCSRSDIVITTAQVFGRPAPRLLTREMISGMAHGSVVVDMAVETGGNVEGSVAGSEVIHGGVRILGLTNLPGRVAVHASQMYANNLAFFIEHFWDREAKKVRVDPADETLAGCLVTHGGSVVHPLVKKMREPKS